MTTTHHSVATLLQAWDEARLRGEPQEPEQITSDPSLQRELRSLILFIEQADQDKARNLRLAPGNSLGAYKLAEHIRSGGEAEIWRANHSAKGDVALRVLRTNDQNAFNKQAEAWHRLRKHVVPLHDFDMAGDLFYLVSQLAGPTLRDFFTSAQLKPYEAAALSALLLKSLHYIHNEANMLHGDITPGNIAITRRGNLAVFDFGLARTEEELTRGTRSMGGTLPYMAPEQLLGKPLDPRTEVYAVGCVLYEALTRRPPFVATNNVSLAAAICGGGLWSPQVHHNDIPSLLDSICTKALSRLPEARFRNARDFSEALSYITPRHAFRSLRAKLRSFARDWERKNVRASRWRAAQYRSTRAVSIATRTVLFPIERALVRPMEWAFRNVWGPYRGNIGRRIIQCGVTVCGLGGAVMVGGYIQDCVSNSTAPEAPVQDIFGGVRDFRITVPPNSGSTTMRLRPDYMESGKLGFDLIIGNGVLHFQAQRNNGMTSWTVAPAGHEPLLTATPQPSPNAPATDPFSWALLPISIDGTVIAAEARCCFSEGLEPVHYDPKNVVTIGGVGQINQEAMPRVATNTSSLTVASAK